MDFKTMTNEELEQRRSQIATELDAPEADLDALESEIRGINEEIETRKADEAKRVEIRKAVANGAGLPVKEIKEEKHTMTINEVRAMPEYVEAYANYIKTEKDDECRALLTTNVVGENPGTVPVPVILEERIRTNWEKNGLLDLVRKTYIRGNVKVGFEVSATPAVIHDEGAAAPTEEQLVLGVVELIPVSVKKWITISDEAMDMGGEDFLYYIYDELTYQIAKCAENSLLHLVVDADASASKTAVSVSQITSDGKDIVSIVFNAIARLSDEATNPVIVMNKQTYAAFRSAQLSANYAVDPFDGLPVYFNSSLKALNASANGDCWLIVGDFGRGAQANFPNGDEIRIKRDDLSLAEKDLVKFVGREYVALNLVSDKCFTRVVYGTGTGA